MNTIKNYCGGCCFLFLITLIVLVTLVLTNPPEAAHRKAFAERAPIPSAFFGVLELLGGPKLVYHDFFFASVMTAKYDNNGNQVPVTIGFFGKVYYGSDK